jgi:hypothetical protein
MRPLGKFNDIPKVSKSEWGIITHRKTRSSDVKSALKVVREQR